MSRLRLAFTGHRDHLAPRRALDFLAAQFPQAVWMHGGAIGFDTQVQLAALDHAIPQHVIRPDYARYGRAAPLRRNDVLLGIAEVLVAWYDGRPGGGTAYTVRQAQVRSVPIIRIREEP